MTDISAQPRRYDRRKFLAGTGAMVVAVNTPRLLNPKSAFAAVKEFPIGPANIDPNQIDSWIAIKGDGTVVVKTGKEELGQGMATAVAQVVADELDVPVGRIQQIISDTWTTVNQGGTSGSQSSPTHFNTDTVGIRKAAAEARAALLGLASTALGQPVSNLTVKDGVVSVKGGSQQTTYATLIGNKTFNLAMTGKAKPKTFQDYKVVGTSVPRVDIPDKVFAKFTYNQDIRLPGMVHARVVRPPTLDSQLVSVDGFPHRIPGLVKVVIKKNFVAVVAEREEQAIAAAAALKVQVERRTAAVVRHPLRGSRRGRSGKDDQPRPDRHEGRRRDARQGREVGLGRVPLPDPDARADGRLRRAGVGAGQHRGRVVAHAERHRRAGDARHGPQHPGAEHPRHLRRGLGRLRPDQRRRRRPRRGHRLPVGRPAGQGAVHARRRPHGRELRRSRTSTG